MTTLKKLALGGRAIITTIHQPATRIFYLIDILLLLSEGQTLYYGESVSFMHTVSFLPENLT